MAGRKKRFTKQEWSWIFYDWANSIYATNIMAAIFPTIFVSIAGDAGDIWWGYGTSIATFLVAVLAPLLGAVAGNLLPALLVGAIEYGFRRIVDIL